MFKDYATVESLKGRCALVNKTTIKIAVVLVLLAGGYTWHVLDKRGYAKERTEHVTRVLNQRYEYALAKSAKEAQEASKSLQAQANKDRETKDEKIRTLSTNLNVALSELRNRPTRPSDLSYSAGSIQACTARELYREDAEFLTREASRAQTVLIERDYYYNEYEKIRKKINGTTE